MSQPLDLKEIEKLLDMIATVGEDFSEEGASKLPPIKMGGFMPSSRLELWQGLVYATHSPKDIASELSSLKDLIAGNLPAKLNIILSKKVFKSYRNSSTHHRWVVSLRW